MTALARGPGSFWVFLGVAVVGAKLAILSVDAVPRIFSGDSGFYLFTALTDNVPNDRSFTYGRMVIRWVTGEGHAIARLITAQVLVSAAGALLLGVGLRLGFGASYRLVALGALLVTFEPLQLAYERFVMTETISTFCYALILVGGLTYLRRPRTVTLVFVALAGVALLSLRLNAVAVAWVLPLALPVLAWRRLSGRAWSRPWLHVAVALFAVIVSHTFYRQAYGILKSGPAAYSYGTGRYALGLASPLVRAEDFPDGVAARILPEVRVPFGLPRDRRYPLQVREFHTWAPDGIALTVLRRTPDVLAADSLSRTVALHAIRRDPVGAVSLSVLTLRSYFDPTLRGAYQPSAFAALIHEELGPRTLPPARELEAFGIGPASVGPSVIRRWHAAGVYYYPFLLLCPLLALAAVFLSDPSLRPSATFVALVAAAMVATGPFLATSTVIRYLHPLAWMNVFVVMLLVHASTTRRRSMPAQSPG